MWTDKKGNKLTGKEFMARWKQGIQNVTPLQQSKTQLFGYMPIVAGIIWGIVITLKIKQWWLFTILIGSFIITSVQILGSLQKYFILAKMEKLISINQEEVIQNEIKKDSTISN